jgi:membrane protein involved in colicin uptake
LTDFLGGGKLGRESPKEGQHAKRTAHLYEGIQAGSGALRAYPKTYLNPLPSRVKTQFSDKL